MLNPIMSCRHVIIELLKQVVSMKRSHQLMSSLNSNFKSFIFIDQENIFKTIHYIFPIAKTVQHQTTANLFHETSFNQVSTIQPKSSLTGK